MLSRPTPWAGQVTAPFSQSRDLQPAMCSCTATVLWSCPMTAFTSEAAEGHLIPSPEGESVAVSLVTFARNSIPPLISSALLGFSSGSESSKSGGKERAEREMGWEHERPWSNAPKSPGTATLTSRAAAPRGGSWVLGGGSPSKDSPLHPARPLAHVPESLLKAFLPRPHQYLFP